MLDANQIQEWKKLILSNPQRKKDEEEVIQTFGTMFHPSNLEKLTKEGFRSFLLFKNNKHWDGIHRQINMITEDMDKLKKALRILLDESKDLKDRLDFLFPPKGENYIKGLGRAIVTPILMVVYPDKYGVYNTKSEEGLRTADLLPDFKRKSFAEKYIAVNHILNDFADEHGLTLWQTDEIIGWVSLGNSPINASNNDDEVATPKSLSEEGIEDYTDFGLEAHLEEFLVENWDKLDIGKEYDILEEDGDLVGQQFITKVGRMDILTRSRDGKEWLVIELKKGRSSDAVVGQTLRYIGWIKEHLAKNDETVRGLIILGEDDEKLRYSIMTLPNVDLMTYKVSFELKNSQQI